MSEIDGSTLEIPNIMGFCPMGCGETLKIGTNGRVYCQEKTCSRPTAVGEILDNPEHEHIVEMRQDGYVIQHPLKERLDDGLFGCKMIGALQGHIPPPAGVEVERYRVTIEPDGGLYWVDLDLPVDDQSVKER